MKKRVKLLLVFLSLFCLLVLSGCGGLATEKIRLKDFNLTLPKGTQLIYEYDKTDAGGGGEGNSFYVNSMPDAESFVSGINSTVQTKEQFIAEFEKFLNYFNPKIDTENLPDLSGNFLWAVKTRSADVRDKVLLVYSYDTQLVYVGIVER